MTGRHEFKNGVTYTIKERERMTLQATTIAQVLKSAGFGRVRRAAEGPFNMVLEARP